MAGEKPKARVRTKALKDNVREVLQSPKTNRAALGYIDEFGAPGANIPPRPCLIPGVKEGLSACEPQGQPQKCNTFRRAEGWEGVYVVHEMEETPVQDVAEGGPPAIAGDEKYWRRVPPRAGR